MASVARCQLLLLLLAALVGGCSAAALAPPRQTNLSRPAAAGFWGRLQQRPPPALAADTAALGRRFRSPPPPLRHLQPAGFSERVRPLLPPSGCWVGSAMDLATWRFDLSAYAEALGFVPASWVVFVELPLTDREVSKLKAVLPRIAALNGIAILTAEPMRGLGAAALSDEQVLELAALIRKYEALGLHVVVRYAHEANGSWYPW